MNKRGKEGNNTLLLVLIAIAAIILFSNNQFNTGFLAKSTPAWKTYGRLPYTQATPTGSGSGAQYATGGVCGCPLHNYDIPCDGTWPNCGKCGKYVPDYTFYTDPKTKRQELIDIRAKLITESCTASPAFCGNGVIEGNRAMRSSWKLLYWWNL